MPISVTHQGTAVLGAQFKICPICRCHGHIRITPNVCDVEVGSKKDIRIRVQILIKKKQITLEEAREILEQLNDLTLADTLTENQVLRLQDQVNQLRNSEADTCAAHLRNFKMFVR